MKANIFTHSYDLENVECGIYIISEKGIHKKTLWALRRFYKIQSEDKWYKNKPINDVVSKE